VSKSGAIFLAAYTALKSMLLLSDDGSVFLAAYTALK